MTKSISQIADDLQKAIAELTAEREAELERVRSSYEEQVQAVQGAIAAIGSNGSTPTLPAEDQRPDVTALSISDKNLNKVRKFMQAHPEGARQADIAGATKLNSGTVSVAMRRLVLEGEVQPSTTKQNGSNFWEPSKVPAAA